MNEPTQEQIKEFWGWCGLHYLAPYWLDSPDDATGNLAFYGETRKELLGSINPNNLFKWAVPKLVELGYEVILFTDKGFCEVEINDRDIPPQKQSQLERDKDPALALFWAIWKVIKGE